MLLHSLLDGYRLILASGSPRRGELLSGADLRFTLAEPFHVDEIYPSDMVPEQVPCYLSELKSNSYPVSLAENDILLTADTVVISGGEVLGKPHDRDDARAMLAKLSGHEHDVITALTIRTNQYTETISSTSKVHFATLTDSEIDYYVDRYQPMDKAGSYGIQEWIGYVAIERIEGSFYNVMGLPIQLLYTNLKNRYGASRK